MSLREFQRLPEYSTSIPTFNIGKSPKANGQTYLYGTKKWKVQRRKRANNNLGWEPDGWMICEVIAWPNPHFKDERGRPAGETVWTRRRLFVDRP